MSNIQFHATHVASGRSLPLCFLVSLPQRFDPSLIYPSKIRNGLNSMKTNDKKISNLSVSPRNALRAAISFTSFRTPFQPPAAGLQPPEPNRNSSGLESRLTYRKQSLVPESNRNKVDISASARPAQGGKKRGPEEIRAPFGVEGRIRARARAGRGGRCESSPWASAFRLPPKRSSRCGCAARRG